MAEGEVPLFFPTPAVLDDCVHPMVGRGLLVATCSMEWTAAGRVSLLLLERSWVIEVEVEEGGDLNRLQNRAILLVKPFRL